MERLLSPNRVDHDLEGFCPPPPEQPNHQIISLPRWALMSYPVSPGNRSQWGGSDDGFTSRLMLHKIEPNSMHSKETQHSHKHSAKHTHTNFVISTRSVKHTHQLFKAHTHAPTQHTQGTTQTHGSTHMCGVWKKARTLRHNTYMHTHTENKTQIQKNAKSTHAHLKKCC